MRICVKCRHCSEKDPRRIWYDYYCHHPLSRRTKTTDPVTGRPCFKFKNDKGRIVLTDVEYPHCRVINPTGECGGFEAR